MNATQSFRIYEILQKHFNNDADAKLIVSEIEQVVDNKLAEKKDILATKDDIARLDLRITALEVLIEKRFNSQTTWLIGTMVACFGLMITVLKLFVVK